MNTVNSSRSIRDFDTHATCLVGNYETADSYYRHTSSCSFVPRVSVPLLCISALDDPVCTSEAIPFNECRANKNTVLATTQHGGHLAFFEGIAGSSLWWVRAVNEFFEALHSSPFMHHQKAQSIDPHSAAMQSSIDQGPYLNITDDSMVAATDNGRTDVDVDVDVDGDVEESFKENEDHNQTNTTISAREEHKFTNGEESTRPTQTPEKSANSKRTSIVERCLYLVSQQNRMSIWLLAYIAIISTWPLVGTALGFFFRKKIKKDSSGMIQK